MKKNIPIFFAFNNDYSIPAAVAFFSLINKAKLETFYQMYVLHPDISFENQKMLKEIAERKNNAELTFINTNGFLDKEWSEGTFTSTYASSVFTQDTLIRCFASKFFPHLDKIIYSDVDVVFMDDISELIDINLNDKYIGAVKGAFSKFSKDELSHFKQEHYEMLKDTYFAGGIWVMNLKKIREDNLEEKMLKIIKDNTIVKRFPDQDIMNIACENKVEFLPLNYIFYPYMQDLLKNPDFESHYTKEEMYDSIFNPKILHFAASKPWNNSPRYSDIWWAIFQYLNLKETNIFSRKTKVNKKLKKYKKLFNIFLIISILLLSVILILLIFK